MKTLRSSQTSANPTVPPFRRSGRYLACRAAQSRSFAEHLLQIQQTLIQEVQALEPGGAQFRQDSWTRTASAEAAFSSSGYGLTAVLERGVILEKAAINTSIITGRLSAARAKAITARGTEVAEGQEYAAAALSLVFHARNPHLPTLRADVRQFQVVDDVWFGGGCDLTPAYLHRKDIAAFHAFWRNLCGGFDPALYPAMKKACDDYFYLPARREHRGTGGIFFDDLRSSSSFDSEKFTTAVLAGFLPSWRDTAATRGQQHFTEEQRQWQLYRRGRYIEFNLLYDRGVKFGLDSGRIESVMVSAPPLVAWGYDVQPKPGSVEHELCKVLAQPVDWVEWEEGDPASASCRDDHENSR